MHLRCVRADGALRVCAALGLPEAQGGSRTDVGSAGESREVKTPAGLTCETCRWYATQGYPAGSGFGDCRRRSPGLGKDAAAWPTVAHDDYCGDAEPLPDVRIN